MDLFSFAISVHSVPVHKDGVNQSECEDERVICQRQDGNVLIGVFDGCGGTGGKRYPQAENWTGAKLAAHLAGRTVHQWFFECSAKGKRVTDLAGEMKEKLQTTFSEYNAELKESDHTQVYFHSKLNKDLPTTLAVMTAQKFSKEGFEICSYWAGNSRNYVFPPSGLGQVSTDDIVGNYDPYEDLTMDGILNNSINASEPFEIHAKSIYTKDPCMILSASDGIFAYLDSPIRLEWILLDTLQEADSPSEWETKLRNVFGEYASDDHTLQLAALGFRDFTEIKERYLPRKETVWNCWIRPLEEARNQQQVNIAKELWESYKRSYLIFDKEKQDGSRERQDNSQRI